MKIVALTKEEFDNFAYHHKYSTYYQTSAYAETSRYEGLNTFYIGFVQDNELVGVTLFLHKTIYLYYKYAYAPRGFLIDYTDSKLVKNVTMGLINLLKKQHYAFIKIDPPIICSERDNKGNIIYFSNTINQILDTLKSNSYIHMGFNKYFENYKPRLNAFVNLTYDLEKIYSNITNEVKEKIENSVKSGLEISLDTTGNIDELYKFIGTKNKKRRKRYYQGMYNNFSRNNAIDIFFVNINTDKYLSNMKRNYDLEAIKNDELASMVQDMSIASSQKQLILNDKMKSDERLNFYKNELIYATNLSRNHPDYFTIGAGFTIKHNNGVELIIDSYLDEYLKFNPRYVFIWELIKKYKNEGFMYINLNGVVGNFSKDKLGKYKNLNDPKLSFNSTIIEYIGEFDLVINDRIYKKYKEEIEKK
ncbi:MAG: aminoacyltransferase [Erysipelotrichaceae bacterium]|nr:aminoacyltransferase [Erysipelotrichaceae bacterium]